MRLDKLDVVAQQPCPVLVGRASELEALRHGLDAAAEGAGRCALLVGEPGIGKSRLAREVAAWGVGTGMSVVTGRAVPSASSAAYRPVAEALLQLLRDRPLPDDPLLAPWVGALQPLVPGLAAPASGGEVTPAVRGEAMLQVLRLVSPHGAVIVLEDLHWADPDTVSLVEYLVDSLRRERLMLVATLRDRPPAPALEMANRHRGSPEVIYLGLERLSGDESAAMVRACRPEVTEAVLARVRDTAEGIPLLVEELLASPGIPSSFAATVVARLVDLDEKDRAIIQAAAVLGRLFDWRLLARTSGQSEEAVAHALEAGVASLLLTTQGGEVQFRHALTREAVIDSLLPPRQRQLAAASLTAVLDARPTLDGRQRATAIDLAVRAGDRHRAGGWMIDSAREALGWGALASSADAFRQAAELLAGCPEQADAELGLVEALALAGRVEEAAAAGGRLVNRLSGQDGCSNLQAQAHLYLAGAAVAAARWQMARHHLDLARQPNGCDLRPDLAAQAGVLEADVLMAEDDYAGARALAERVAASDAAPPASRCHALEIIGRTHRSFDLLSARRAFDRALVTAEEANLPLWRMRALHELGTVDLFDHAGTERLLQARQAAEQAGAVSTVAILDLQLSAAFTCRWDLDTCDAHARAALEAAGRFGLAQVASKALALLAGSASLRADLTATEKYAQLSLAAAPHDEVLQGLCLGGRGIALLMAGEFRSCVGPYARGMAILARLPHADPAALRALWPLVLSALGDRQAGPAVDEARRLGVATFGLNAGLIGYAEAVAAGRRGEGKRAAELADGADARFANCETWRDLARVLAAPDALAAGWGDVNGWLTQASDRFSQLQLPALRARCEELLGRQSVNPWAKSGVTAREADVLRLVAEGLGNKDIASRLHLSPRTVEKHIESLLRKTGSRSRTELVARLRPAASPALPSAPVT